MTMNESRPALVTAGGYQLPSNWLLRVVLIWSGFALSSFAGAAASYASVWYVTEATQSPLALGFLYVCAFLPMGLLAPLGGVVADKLNRKHIVMAMDGVVALSGVVLALVIGFGHVGYGAVVVFCLVYSVACAFRQPAFNAVMPLLVPEKQLMRINTLDGLLSSVSMIAAPALGIFLYTVFGLQVVMALDALGALAAVVTMAIAKIPEIPRTPQEIGPWESMKQGAGALAGSKGLMIVVLAVAVGMMAYGPMDSLLPLMVSAHFNGDGTAASIVAAVMGVGMFVGSLVLMIANFQRGLTRVIVVASFVVGVSCFVAGRLPETAFWLFVSCIGVMGIACAWFNAPLMTLLQKGIAEDKLGRVMGLFSSMIGIAVPVGTMLGGTVAELVGTPLFFSADGLVVIVIGLVVAFPKCVRALDKPQEE